MARSLTRLAVVGLASALLVLVAMQTFGPGRSCVPAVTPDQVDEIEVVVEEFQTQPAQTFLTRDPAAIAAFLGVFETAKPTTEHKCATWARITIRKKDESAEVLGVLPGHDANYYEYRYARTINRVDRARFLTAMKAVGVEQVKLTAP